MSALGSEKSLARVVLEGVNAGVDSEAFVNDVANDHRRLQGKVFDQIVKPLVCEYARLAESGQYDARNERQVKECKEIADALNWHY